MRASPRRGVVAVATLLVVLTTFVSVDAQSCVHNFDGFYYDLRSLKGRVFTVPTTDYTYAFTLCENIPKNDPKWGACGAKEPSGTGNACQFDSSGTVIGMLGVWTTKQPPVWSLFADANMNEQPAALTATAEVVPTTETDAPTVAATPTDTDASAVAATPEAEPADVELQLMLDNGSNCHDPTAPRVSKFRFKCDPNEADPSIYVTPDGPDGGTCTTKGGYIFTITGPVGCAHKGTSGGGDSGLSGGWVFIIILLVGMFVYCVAGCVWMNRREGATGLDMIPQKAFWGSLPGYVLDGCRATWSFALGLCNKGGGGGGGGASSYDEIE